MVNTDTHSYLRKKTSGFTLIEFLVVLGIIMLLISISLPMIESFKGNQLKLGLVEISNSIEKARLYAKEKNTYTYIAFSSDGGHGPSVYVAVFALHKGENLARFGEKSTLLVPTPQEEYSGLALVGKIEKIEQFSIINEIPEESKITIDESVDATYCEGDPTIEYNHPSLGNLVFDKVIQFTPAGDLRVGTHPVEKVQIIAYSQKGSEPSERELKKAVAIRISGITGQIVIVEP